MKIIKKFKSTKAKIGKMLVIQNEVNIVIDPEWLKNRSKKDFIRAIWAECSELMASLEWKWWTVPDPRNIYIEIVDIWHFILSYIILDAGSVSDAKNNKLLDIFIEGLNFSRESDVNGEQYLSDSQYSYLLSEQDDTKKKVFLNEEIAKSFLNLHVEMGVFLFGVLVKEATSFDKFYLMYIGKSVLNKVRQEKGYKKGTYTKKIEGMEDNMYLYEIVSKAKDEKSLEKKIRKAMDKLQVVE